jgi:hypothetical protein
VTLHVDPAALRNYVGELTTITDQVITARSYAAKWSGFSWQQAGLLATLAGSHHQFADAVIASLNRVTELLDRASENLTQMASAYSSTDGASAARIDAALPAVPRVVGRTPQMDRGGED